MSMAGGEWMRVLIIQHGFSIIANNHSINVLVVLQLIDKKKI